MAHNDSWKLACACSSTGNRKLTMKIISKDVPADLIMLSMYPMANKTYIKRARNQIDGMNGTSAIYISLASNPSANALARTMYFRSG